MGQVNILRHFHLDPDSSSAWSADIYAKAKLADEQDARPYVPVSRSRLEDFENSNDKILSIARDLYSRF